MEILYWNFGLVTLVKPTTTKNCSEKFDYNTSALNSIELFAFYFSPIIRSILSILASTSPAESSFSEAKWILEAVKSGIDKVGDRLRVKHFMKMSPEEWIDGCWRKKFRDLLNEISNNTLAHTLSEDDNEERME